MSSRDLYARGFTDLGAYGHVFARWPTTPWAATAKGWACRIRARKDHR
jgi:hypothetical protein